jgi:hypothetical protein
MKKLYSFAALGALFYAMPACANKLAPETQISSFNDSIVPILIFLVSLAIQAFILHLYFKKLSPIQAASMACVGYIPSLLLGLYNPFSTHRYFIDFIIQSYKNIETSLYNYIVALVPITLIATFTSTLLMLMVISFTYGYKPKQLMKPVFLSNVAFYILFFSLNILLRR